jgi:hypothetical protein
MFTVLFLFFFLYIQMFFCIFMKLFITLLKNVNKSKTSAGRFYIKVNIYAVNLIFFKSVANFPLFDEFKVFRDCFMLLFVASWFCLRLKPRSVIYTLFNIDLKILSARQKSLDY